MNDLRASNDEFADDLAFVARTLRRHGVRPNDTEDLAQEVFLVAWRRRADFDDRLPLRPWLAGIAARIALRHRRRRWPEVGITDEQAAEGNRPPRPAPELEVAETRALVLATLARLPERHREVLGLHDLEGLTVEEIALRWAVPRFTVYTRLRRARLAFAKELEEVAPSRSERRRVLRALAAFPTAEVWSLAPERHGPPPLHTRPRGSWLALSGTVAAAVGALGYLAAVVTESRPGPAVHAALANSLQQQRVMAPAFAAPAPARASRPVLRPVPIESVASASTLGLAAHWPFDDAAPSPAAADVSGHGHDCVLRRLDPTRAWVPGNVSGAVELGFNGWLECRQPHLPARASTSLSVGAWVKRAGNPRYHHAIATRPMPSGPANYFYFGFRDDQLMVMGHGWKGVLSAPIAHTPGTWMHVAFTHGPDHETKLFVNGAEVARQSSPPRALPAITTPLFVGGGFAANDRTRVRQLFEGSIDELRLYDRALTPEEIRGLASTSPARPTP